MRASQSRRTSPPIRRRALLAGLLFILFVLASSTFALPADEVPAESGAAVLWQNALWQNTLWQDLVEWVASRVGRDASESAPPADPVPATRTQTFEECGTPAECEAGVDIEPHG